MRLGLVPENPLERLALAVGAVPEPMFDTLMALLLARTIMTGTKAGVFEALRHGPRNAKQVAQRCGTHPKATAKLLRALAASGYLSIREDQFSLTRRARKWLLEDSPSSLYESTLFRYMEWDIAGHFEDYLQSGEPLDVHNSLSTADQWRVYQRGMRSTAGLIGNELARRVPLAQGARTMLDIGGSHGYLSICFCRRHPGLQATVLDLPEAIEHARPLVAAEHMSHRVSHRAGDVLEEELGEREWDVVLMANLAHHFDAQTNQALAKRVAKALRPGGTFIIQEMERPRSVDDAGQPGALMDLFFAVTSQSGTWSFDEMAQWQRDAGLIPQRPLRFRSAPGNGAQIAQKPR